MLKYKQARQADLLSSRGEVGLSTTQCMWARHADEVTSVICRPGLTVLWLGLGHTLSIGCYQACRTIALPGLLQRPCVAASCVDAMLSS